MSSLDWLEQAACANPVGLDSRFFAEVRQGTTAEEKDQAKRDLAGAKAMCDGVPMVTRNADGEAVVKWGRRPCPVRDRCLGLAMRNEGVAPHRDRAGIYGGKTPKERAALALELGVEARLPNETRSKKCMRPGTPAGAAKHFIAAEPYCEPCTAHSLDEVEAQAVRRMVETGVTNMEIFARTMADRYHVQAIRLALCIPDPGRKTATREVDEAAVLRRLAGDPVPLQPVDTKEVVRRAHGLGWNDHEIAERCDLSLRNVERVRRALRLTHNHDPAIASMKAARTVETKGRAA